MSIADKLTTIAENQQKVYDAGYAAGQKAGGGSTGDDDLLKYVPATGSTWQLFSRAVFTERPDLVVSLPGGPTSIYEMFYMAVGFNSLTLRVPSTGGPYKADSFVYGSSQGTSTVKTLTLPDGIRFSQFNRFAQNSVNLETVLFERDPEADPDAELVGIDLSESTNNATCFNNCPLLTEVRFKANSIKSSLGFNQSSNLSLDSIASIVEGLAYVTTQQTLTLHSDVIDNLTANHPDLLQAIYDKNWIT